MGYLIITPSLLYIIGSILASVDCQLRVKVIRPESVVAETRFNWSSIQQNNSFPTEILRIYQYAQLPLQQNARQPVCDQRCGVPYDRAAPLRVIGGTSTKPNQFPWMVQLLIVFADFFQQKQATCAATLIKQQYLLTAAHCIYYRKIISITAFLGFHYMDIERFDKTGYEEIIPVKQAFVHDDFDLTLMRNDIAILELVKPVRFTDQVHTICLAESEPASTVTDATVAGWGTTEAFGTQFVPQMLLSGTVPLVKLPQCKQALLGMGKMLTEQSVCAGGTKTDACTGDSGGPLMVTENSLNSRTTRYNQIGIVSWGVGCAQPNMPGIYSSTWHYLPWIQQVTRKEVCRPVSPNPSN
ncbi:trypsin-like [Daphnia carinata]|uniref:trypsin-like n=1 Tax=Daphnia carinata TaxID=120202 RepID=UPI00257C941B|nr:trypsin-like [Daphnia carinata]